MVLLMINIKTLLLLAIVAIIAISCAKVFTRNVVASDEPLLAGYANVGVDTFQNLIGDPVVQLLDVRSDDEFEDGHIAGAIHIDVNDNDFEAKASQALDDKRPVAVYCRSGRRSARAASMLSGLGYKVTNLAGGVIAWEDAGKALVQ